MRFDSPKFTAIVADAKTKAAGNAKWIRAIERAAAGLQSGDVVVTLLADNTALVTTPNASYRVNGRCHCEAARRGHTQCYHRAAKRLVEMYEAAATVETKPATSRLVERAELIAEIETAWPSTWPPLAVELMARFGVNSLMFLDNDLLRRVRLAVAM